MPLFLGEDKISKVVVASESADGGINTNDATLNSGAQMLSGVTAYSKGQKYIGTIATVTGPTPNIAVSDSGLITASVSNPKGYQSNATTKTATQQLSIQGAKTITPNNSNQTAVNSGIYTTGAVTVSAVPTETKKITANGTYSPSSGKYFSSVEVNIPSSESTVSLQEKTVVPSESEQIVTSDSGYDGLSNVTVEAIPSTYVGSAVPIKETTTIVPSVSMQTAVSAGTYVTGEVQVDAIPSNYVDTSDAQAYSNTILEGYSAYVNGAKVNGEVPIAENRYATDSSLFNSNNAFYGSAMYFRPQYCSNFPSGDRIAIKPDTVFEIPGSYLGDARWNSVLEGFTFTSSYGMKITGTIPSKTAETIIPTTTNQTISAGQYLSGAQTIQGDANLKAENIVSGVTIFGVAGTAQTGGSGGTTTPETCSAYIEVYTVSDFMVVYTVIENGKEETYAEQSANTVDVSNLKKGSLVVVYAPNNSSDSATGNAEAIAMSSDYACIVYSVSGDCEIIVN